MFCTFVAVDMQTVFHNRRHAAVFGGGAEVWSASKRVPGDFFLQTKQRGRPVNACAGSGGKRGSSAVLVNLEKYIKIVVIVNAERTVDKSGLLHMLKGLRRFEKAGQALYAARTLTGQKSGWSLAWGLRTNRPVDMHGVVHIR